MKFPLENSHRKPYMEKDSLSITVYLYFSKGTYFLPWTRVSCTHIIDYTINIDIPSVGEPNPLLPHFYNFQASHLLFAEVDIYKNALNELIHLCSDNIEIIFHMMKRGNNHKVAAVLTGGKGNVPIFFFNKSCKLKHFLQGSQIKEKEIKMMIVV